MCNALFLHWPAEVLNHTVDGKGYNKANDVLRRKLSSICMWSSYCQSLKHQRATPRKVLINILQAQQTLSSPYLVMGDFNNSNVTDAFSNMKLSL